MSLRQSAGIHAPEHRWSAGCHATATGRDQRRTGRAQIQREKIETAMKWSAHRIRPKIYVFQRLNYWA